MKVKNTYFLAILEATSSGLYFDYSDHWRCYHATSLMLDSDYCFFNDLSFETTEESMSLAGKVVRRAQAMSKTKPATTIY